MDAPSDSLYQSLLQAMAAIREGCGGEGKTLQAVAVAYSGGLDSGVLLHLMQRYAREQGMGLTALHIHHGLSANADTWLEHCRQASLALNIAFAAHQVSVDTQAGNGVEEAAREARYAALGALCIEHGLPLLLTAHHVDDQAETILLQMLRGSGLAGISGMEAFNRAPGLLGTPAVTIARPLLKATRAELECYAQQHGLVNIEDESNADPRYARNALRHQVMPVLDGIFPGFAQRFARTAQHAQTAQHLLGELAAQDLERCAAGQALSVEQIRQLSAERADNMLRHWFASRGLRMPSTSWLSELRTQLLIAKADARLCVTHADCHVRRHRDHVYITPRNDDLPSGVGPQHFAWNGEAAMAFPAYRGTLHFDRVSAGGIHAAWLKGKACLMHYRQGGERLKAAANRPTRDLKHHYQANDIPAWERETLPLVSSNGKLLFAAGLGVNYASVELAPEADGEAGVMLRWQPESL